MVSLELEHTLDSIKTKHDASVRSSSASPRRDSVKSVHFARLPTPGSRAQCLEGQWRMYDFELHAGQCTTCSNPAIVIVSGRRLCTTGLVLAQAVVDMIQLVEGVPCETRLEDGRQIRVEIPSTYVHAAQLLAVMHLIHPLRVSPQHLAVRSRDDSPLRYRVLDEASPRTLPIQTRRVVGRSRSPLSICDDDDGADDRRSLSSSGRAGSRSRRDSVHQITISPATPPRRTYRTETRTPEASPSRGQRGRRTSICSPSPPLAKTVYSTEIRTPERVKRQSYCLPAGSGRLRK